MGFGRVAAMELPDLRPRLIDLDPLKLQRSSRSIDGARLRAWRPIATEGEIAYRGGKRFAARLVQDASIVADADGERCAVDGRPRGPFQLRITQAGSFDALAYVPVEREPPAAGQVEIEVHAAGLNFSDVLKALGLYPGIKDAIVPLGIEASGVVTAVGEGVTRFRVGDEVFGVVPYAFASHARTAEYALVHKPKSIDHDAGVHDSDHVSHRLLRAGAIGPVAAGRARADSRRRRRRGSGGDSDRADKSAPRSSRRPAARRSARFCGRSA